MTQADINAMSVVRNTLDKLDANYKYYSDKNVIDMNLPLRCKLGSYRLIIACNNGFFRYVAFLNVNADEKKRDDIAEFFAYVNDGIMFGAVFEFDYSDGKMSVRMSACYDDGCLNEETVVNCLSYTDRVLEKYGDALLMVLFGMATPKEAFYKVKNS